jgi:hypothetical protein
MGHARPSTAIPENGISIVESFQKSHSIIVKHGHAKVSENQVHTRSATQDKRAASL